jgi:hypothetical protein
MTMAPGISDAVFDQMLFECVTQSDGLLLLCDDEVLDLVIGGLRDDLLVDQFVLPFVRPTLDDRVGVGGADSGQRLELFGSSRVEVD